MRTAPISPSVPDVILHPAGISSHSLTSQYLPTRFHTSAAERSTVISIAMVVYVGDATTTEPFGAAGAGACG